MLSDSKMGMDKYFLQLEKQPFKAVAVIRDTRYAKRLARITGIVFGFMILALFLPWTQNISGSGAVTTLKPECFVLAIAFWIDNEWYGRRNK